MNFRGVNYEVPDLSVIPLDLDPIRDGANNTATT